MMAATRGGGDDVRVSRRPIRWRVAAALLAITALAAVVAAVARAVDLDDEVNLADLAAVAIAAAAAAAAVVAWAKGRNPTTTEGPARADASTAADVLADLVRRQ